ncbi:hypothetical protein TNCV_3250571 [Trichonephila clavipes]|nr:hypothetical protein TNCV_3250571 [Trichonephila clavipes]
MFDPSSFADPTPLAHADTSRDVLERGGTSQLHVSGTPIDAVLRGEILKLGPYQPEGNFQKDAKGRSNLQKVYSLDLSSEFPNQIMSLKAVFSEDLIKLNSIKDLGNFLMIQNKLAAPSLPDVCIAVLLFLTLPVISAIAER